MKTALVICAFAIFGPIAGCATGNQAPTANNFGVAVGMLTGLSQPEHPKEYYDKVKNCNDGVHRSFPDGDPCPEDKALGITQGGK